jgi:hypothetical protein
MLMKLIKKNKRPIQKNTEDHPHYIHIINIYTRAHARGHLYFTNVHGIQLTTKVC